MGDIFLCILAGGLWGAVVAYFKWWGEDGWILSGIGGGLVALLTLLILYYFGV